MTTRQLTALGRRFMLRLEMHEWIARAEFKFVRLKGLYGESCWHSEERQCWIAIAPSKNDDELAETLLHEVLHVLIEGHHSPMGLEYYDEGYELALNRMAKAYWKAWKNA